MYIFFISIQWFIIVYTKTILNGDGLSAYNITKYISYKYVFFDITTKLINLTISNK